MFFFLLDENYKDHDTEIEKIGVFVLASKSEISLLVSSKTAEC